MKVKFLRQHLENKQGDVVEVEDERANYWLLTGVAEKVQVEELKEKKSDVKPTPKAKK